MDVKIASSIKKVGCIGCLSCIGILFLICIFIFVYTSPHDENLYYIEDADMYVNFNRNGGGDMGCVSFGKTIEDIDRKLDCVMVNRKRNYNASIVIEKAGDSIFFDVGFEGEIIIESSTHYHICPLFPPPVEIKIKELDGSVRTAKTFDRTYDKRFRDNAGNYLNLVYAWDKYWHEKNPLLVEDEYIYGKINYDKVKKLDPIDRKHHGK